MKKEWLLHLYIMTKYSLIGVAVQLLLLTTTFAANVEGQQIKSVRDVMINVDFEDTSLREVFNYIESKTDFRFTVFEDEAYLKERINYKKSSITVEQLLLNISKKNRLRFQQINNNIGVKRISDSTGQKYPIEIVIQGVTISGKVSSQDDTGGLPGVNVLVKGTSVGTVTDVAGNYSLEVPDENAVLVFSSVGYVTEEVPVGTSSVIDLEMVADIKALEEIVVVGYGTQKKSDITGAVFSFDMETIKERPQTNIVQALQGTVAGLNVTTTASSAEDGATMFIRGQNSITASNNPLIVLDGIPYTGGLSSLSPNDIKSIEVLKDASSTAIYGSRGANGVILIGTKQGGKGALKVSYNGYYSFDEIAHMTDMQDAPEYWGYRWDRLVTNPLSMYTNSGETVALRITQAFSGNENTNTEIRSFMMGHPGQTWNGLVEDITSNYDPYTSDYETLQQIAADFAYPEESRNTDWVDLATRTGHKQRHNVAFSGGGDAAQYFTSVDYNNVEGIAIGDDYQSMVFRINLNLKIFDWMKFGTNTHLGFYDRSGVKTNFGGNSGAFVFNPLFEPYNDNGSINIYPQAENLTVKSPLEPLLFDNSDQQKRITTNNYLDIDVPGVKGLKYRLNTGYMWTDRIQRTYKGNNTVEGANNNGQLTISDGKGYDWTIENILSYTRKFGVHNLFITALYSAQEKLSDGNSYTGRGFDNDVRTWYQLGSAETITASASYVKRNYTSQMFRANYGYDDRYLLTATIRRDGYSAFGESTKFGLFPSIALGWNIANEQFTNSWENIEALKLRLSYGENGNDAISAYATLPTMSKRNYIDEFGTVLYGYYPSKLENPDLGWETTRSFNVGLDISLWSGRVIASMDAYKSKTSDLLLNETISAINGTTSITRNIGETSNSGFEFQASTVNINKKQFSWKTDLNLSTYNTKIVNVGLYDEDGNPADDIASEWFIGQPVSVNFDYVLDRILQKDDFLLDANGDFILDANGAPILRGDVADEVVVFGAAFPGKPIVKDVDENGSLGGSGDKELIGNTMPDLTLGMTNTFRYKNLTFSFFLTGVWGVTRRNEIIDVLAYTGARQASGIEYWTLDNPTTDIPGVNMSGTTGQNIVLYESADFVRLQDMTLSYDLPKAWVQKISFSDFTAFINVKNAYTFTDWQGLDPEYSSVRGVPRARSYVLGLRFSF